MEEVNRLRNQVRKAEEDKQVMEVKLEYMEKIVIKKDGKG